MSDFPSVPKWNGQDCDFMLMKRDGHQLTIERSSTGRIRCTTRTPTDITYKIPWVWKPLLQRMPLDCTLVGELWLPGHAHSAVKTAIKESNESLRWDAFAILTEAADMRQDLVEEWLTARGLPHISYQRTTWQDDLERFMVQAEHDFIDCEGWVLKDTNMSRMFKWKPECTMDLIVKGTIDGKGKYLGQLGALVLETEEGYEVANVSGMSDEQRLDMSIDDPTGKVVEVRYQSIGTKGRLRHPAFKRFRPDKQPGDCSAWQDDRLITYWHAQ